MAFPAWTDLLTFVVILVIGVPLVYLFSKAVRLRTKPIEIAEKNKQAKLSLMVFLAVFAIAFAILAYYAYGWVRMTLTEDLIYVSRDTMWIIAILLPMAVVLKWTRQSLGSIGITRKNLNKNLALGFLLSAAFIAIIAFLAPSIGGGFTQFSVPMALSLVSFAIIGFGEETIFRGYIQTRLTAQIGTVTGIIIVAIIYAIFQFPVGYFCYNGDITSAVYYALWRLSSGLVFGYVFQRSQNIIPSSIFHTLLVWGALLWGLYF